MSTSRRGEVVGQRSLFASATCMRCDLAAPPPGLTRRPAAATRARRLPPKDRLPCLRLLLPLSAFPSTFPPFAFPTRRSSVRSLRLSPCCSTASPAPRWLPWLPLRRASCWRRCCGRRCSPEDSTKRPTPGFSPSTRPPAPLRASEAIRLFRSSLAVRRWPPHRLPSGASSTNCTLSSSVSTSAPRSPGSGTPVARWWLRSSWKAREMSLLPRRRQPFRSQRPCPPGLQRLPLGAN